MHELARVTRPGGVVVVSTPNRLTFSPGLARREPPPNLYHCREYDAAELRGELARWLPGASVEVVGLAHGPTLSRWEAAHGSIVAAQQDPDPAAWAAPVRSAVEAVTALDFVLGGPDDACLDLFAVVRLA